MQNIEHTLKGGKLTLVIDVSPAALAAAGPSGSGKNSTVATTAGNKPISLPNGITLYLGVNAYVKRT